MQETDIKLVELTRVGDTAAFGGLVRRYQGLVYGIAYHKLGNFADAQDVAQETFIKAFRCINQLEQPERFGAWLKTITTNECRMWLRSNQPAVPLDEAEASPAYTSLAVESWKRLEHQTEIRRTVDHLPEKSRLIVSLHYLSGLSHREIGEFLGMTANTVSQHLHRARHQLKDMLMAEIEEGYVMNKLPESFAEEVLGKLKLHPMREGYIVTAPGDGVNGGLMLAVEGPEVEKSYIWLWMHSDDMREIVLGNLPARTSENAKGRALDSTLEMLRALGIELQQVILRLTGDRRCRAEVTLKQGDRELTLDMRASDAMGLALRAQAPIFAEEPLIRMGNVGEGDAPTPDERVDREAYDEEFRKSTQHDMLMEKAREIGLSTEDWMDTARFSIDESNGTIRIWLEALPDKEAILGIKDYSAGMEMLTDLAKRRSSTGWMTGDFITGKATHFKYFYSFLDGDIRVRVVPDDVNTAETDTPANGNQQ